MTATTARDGTRTPSIEPLVEIPEKYRDLFERPIVVSLATVLPDGQPQVTPVWCDLHEGHIRVNTAQGRRKHRDMVERPQVTVMALDPDNPFRYVEVRGRVVQITEEGADAHIDALAKQYLGVDRYPNHSDQETRVTCVIAPRLISAMG
ncbi:MAG TPA: TIGR03618 family F420-dependent PPOX class oxidoreductase [Thermomicrobiales bacterium]|nr:TIGR03618 family F420-dependent PPOX class oxidoreductase [Thermomicrobiales bacterium]